MAITSATEALALPRGQWAIDANDQAWCLVDTHMGHPQVMWMAKGGKRFVAIDRAVYPLELADLREPHGHTCPHKRTTECGHCTRCGVVAAEPRPVIGGIHV